MAMTCPKCRREMQEILSEGVDIDFCTGCKGTFLDKGEHPNFAGYPEAVNKALEAGLRDSKPADFACPRCAGRMRAGWILSRDYELERCDACHGLWFDSRELSRLKKLQPGAEPPPVPNVPPKARPRTGDVAISDGVTAPSPRPGRRSSGMICPNCDEPPRDTDQWQCRCGFQWHAANTAGVCPRCRRKWEELQCLRCAAWAPPAKWMGR
jgi:Zn-finger nucleic acid-binding protein